MANIGLPIQTLPGTILETDGLKEGGVVKSISPVEKLDMLLFASSSYLDPTDTIIYTWYMGSHESAIIEIAGNDGHAYTFEGSMNLQNWYPIVLFRKPSASIDYPYVPYESIPQYSNVVYCFNKEYRYARIRKRLNNSALRATICRFSINLLSSKLDISIDNKMYPQSSWMYSPLEPVTSASAQTVAPAAGNYILNYIQSVVITNAGTSGSVVRMLAGAGGSTILSFYVAAGQRIEKNYRNIVPFNSQLIQIVVETPGASIYPIIEGFKAQR